MAGDILVAKKTASLVWNGRPIVIKRGITTVRAGHPLLEAAGEMFEPFRVDFDTDERIVTRSAKEPASVQEPDAKAVPARERSRGGSRARGKLSTEAAQE